MSQGITFTVYGEREGLERIFPFDSCPASSPREWNHPGRLSSVSPPSLFILDICGGAVWDNLLPAS
jgi:hypothetical protein